MNLPVAFGALVVAILVHAGWVASRLRTCYFGPPPEPRPGEHWMQAAAREIRKRCPRTTRGLTDGTRFEACQAVFNDGTRSSSVYTIYPSAQTNGLQVYCDMINGIDAMFDGGWIVIQKRYDGSVNFTRSWAEYRDGFGNLTGEFWLGNELVRQLTSEGNWILMVDFISQNGNRNIAIYAEFSIKGDDFQLHVGDFLDVPRLDAWFILPIGDSLAMHKMKSFSTFDRDNDEDGSVNCADQSKGGWWFGRCTLYTDEVQSNLNGEYTLDLDFLDTFRSIAWAQSSNGILKSEIKMRKLTKL